MCAMSPRLLRPLASLPLRIDYLVVGGGGGSTQGRGGGGGGGGVIYGQGFEPVSGASYAVSVGQGGTVSLTAENSVFSSFTAIGGGRGGSFGGAGASGGSGGGGGGSTTSRLGGSGTTGQGNRGGNNNTSFPLAAAGGGGAGAAAADVSSDLPTAGGIGFLSSITGTPTYYAGGGGGSGGSGAAGGALGGLGGGGKGTSFNAALPPAGNGEANTGGGGGGGGGDANAVPPGNGGSGVVILRYPRRFALTVSPSLTYSTSDIGDWRIARFTAGTGYVAWRVPQVSNAEAQDWINRVYANGGTVSTSTANAVSAFCDAIEGAGIRDRFARLNLFCGDSLNAALVPLYRSTSYGGSALGNATDTNNAFVGVGTDYAETGASGGLTGNGSTKRLNTGLQQVAVSNDGTGHLSVYYRHKTAPANSVTWRVIGAGVTGGSNDYYYDVATLNDKTLRRHAHGGSAATFDNSGSNITAWATNHVGVTRTGATTLRDWFGSSIFAGSTTSVSPSGLAAAITVFAFNLDGTNPILHANATLGGYSIGLSLTDAQITAFQTAMETFQAALGRNVSVP